MGAWLNGGLSGVTGASVGLTPGSADYYTGGMFSGNGQMMGMCAMAGVPCSISPFGGMGALGMNMGMGVNMGLGLGQVGLGTMMADPMFMQMMMQQQMGAQIGLNLNLGLNGMGLGLNGMGMMGLNPGMMLGMNPFFTAGMNPFAMQGMMNPWGMGMNSSPFSMMSPWGSPFGTMAPWGGNNAALYQQQLYQQQLYAQMQQYQQIQQYQYYQRAQQAQWAVQVSGQQVYEATIRHQYTVQQAQWLLYGQGNGGGWFGFPGFTAGLGLNVSAGGGGRIF